MKYQNISKSLFIIATTIVVSEQFMFNFEALSEEIGKSAVKNLPPLNG